MCKPGSASGGGVTSSGLGVAFAVLGIAAVVSMASAFIGTILTAALITVFSLAAAGTVLLVVILYRTRSVVTWPMRTAPPLAARRRVAPAQPVTGAAARPAVAAREPLAIEAPAPVSVRIGVPVGPADLALAEWLTASGPALTARRGRWHDLPGERALAGDHDELPVAAAADPEELVVCLLKDA